MNCLRCGGAVVVEVFTDLREGGGEPAFEGERCLNCGAIEDPVVRANRRHPPPVPYSRTGGAVARVRAVSLPFRPLPPCADRGEIDAI